MESCVTRYLGVAAVPAVLILGIGFFATIGFGWVFDEIDTSKGYKKKLMFFLKEAFPDLNTENILDYFFADNVNEVIQEQENRINRYEYEQAMRGSGMFGF